MPISKYTCSGGDSVALGRPIVLLLLFHLPPSSPLPGISSGPLQCYVQDNSALNGFNQPTTVTNRRPSPAFRDVVHHLARLGVLTGHVVCEHVAQSSLGTHWNTGTSLSADTVTLRRDIKITLLLYIRKTERRDSSLVQRQTRGRKVAGSSPGRSGGIIFVSPWSAYRADSYFGIRSTAVLQQLHVKDTVILPKVQVEGYSYGKTDWQIQRWNDRQVHGRNKRQTNTTAEG